MSDKEFENNDSRGNASDEIYSCFRDHLLIALPSLGGDFFANTVTYMVEHNSQGAFGLVINKPLQLNMVDLFGEEEYDGLADSLVPVLDGGPVRRDSVFFLHEGGFEYQYTQQLSHDVNLTTSVDLVQGLAAGHGPSRALTIMGYAGWDNGQLEKELAEDVWLISPATPEILFDTPYDQRASAAASLLGVDLNLMATNAGHG